MLLLSKILIFIIFDKTFIMKSKILTIGLIALALSTFGKSKKARISQ